MSDFGLGNLVGKITGKLANVANSSQELMCIGECGKITKHITISYADYFQSESYLREGGEVEGTGNGIFGTVMDFTPGLPVATGNTYACICCDKIRFHGGALSHSYNKRIYYLYLHKK